MNYTEPNQTQSRVHITYDIETEDGVEKKELPFVIGVLGDFDGNKPSSAQTPLKKRNFITIDKHNFSEVMKKICPEVNLSIKQDLENTSKKSPIQLHFKCLDDFKPENIIQKIPFLAKLLKIRSQLKELLTRMDYSEELETILQKAIQEPKLLHQIEKFINIKEKP